MIQFPEIGAESGIRTHTPFYGPRGLSPLRLPFRHLGSFHTPTTSATLKILTMDCAVTRSRGLTVGVLTYAVCRRSRLAKYAQTTIGIIGGTGLYQLEGFEDAQWVAVQSPFGTPSDELLIGELGEYRVAFLPRHGRGHRVSPSEVNYRANIDALKRAGADRILAFSAVGSLKEELAPGMFVLVDQYIDRTSGRESSFFGEGFVAHVSMADPVCSTMNDAVEEAANSLGINYVRGGTYLAMNGPQFSTRAESNLYRSWDADIIGMTNMPEAKLAREAEMAYTTVAMVTDYDCWHEEHEDVSASLVLEVLRSNTDGARALIKAAVPIIGALEAPFPSGVHTALEHAIATAPQDRDPALMRKLDAVAGRVLKNEGWAG